MLEECTENAELRWRTTSEVREDIMRSPTGLLRLTRPRENSGGLHVAAVPIDGAGDDVVPVCRVPAERVAERRVVGRGIWPRTGCSPPEPRSQPMTSTQRRRCRSRSALAANGRRLVVARSPRRGPTPSRGATELFAIGKPRTGGPARVLGDVGPALRGGRLPDRVLVLQQACGVVQRVAHLSEPLRHRMVISQH